MPRLSCDLPEDKDARHPGMVWVPLGEFDMGDTVYREEGPLQRTRVQGFWMDRTEVSNAEFARFDWRHPGGPDTTIEGREALPVQANT